MIERRAVLILGYRNIWQRMKLIDAHKMHKMHRSELDDALWSNISTKRQVSDFDLSPCVPCASCGDTFS